MTGVIGLLILPILATMALLFRYTSFNKNEKNIYVVVIYILFSIKPSFNKYCSKLDSMISGRKCRIKVKIIGLVYAIIARISKHQL